jgi:cytochrome c-type biogenesis protein CcmH
MRRSLIFLTTLGLLIVILGAAGPQDLEDQTTKIASELRCPVCQNLSAADSPSELAQEMRQFILEELKQGKSPEQIKSYFVSKYGEWVLLAPTPKGFSLLLWILPFVAAGAGILVVLFLVRRWEKKKKRGADPETPASVGQPERPTSTAKALSSKPPPEPTRPSLLEEQAKLSAELEELDFDFHSGRFSEADYKELRKELEDEAVIIRKKLDALPPPPRNESPIPSRSATMRSKPASRRNWQLVAGGVFLLLFGITLGLFLSKSLRPRASESDIMTGDFLTGTGPGGVTGNSGNDAESFLAQGRAAFERHDWPQAIDAFKKTLAIDPNQPEAHSYMGFILAQAGHADGALLAFDRALMTNPDFPPALWGKGMLLYQVKKDLPAARQSLERLVSLMPPGSERNEVENTVAEMAQQSGEKKESTKAAPAKGSSIIRGVVSIDPKLKDRVGEGTLFIIARSATASGGPPLAVKKIERPKFPASFSLGPENVMIPGTALSGKIALSARLDKDGDPTTKEPGNLTGEYKKNPVEVGAEKIDIVLDQIM